MHSSPQRPIRCSLAFKVKSNWATHPTGSATELAAIEKAAEVVRAAHPYVSVGS
jgi:hypothetical protein